MRKGKVKRIDYLPGGGPRYWRDETSGRLAEAVAAYLKCSPGLPLSLTAIEHLRMYLLHWAEAPCFRSNPAANPKHRAALLALASRAENIESREDIGEWVESALTLGLDPF